MDWLESNADLRVQHIADVRQQVQFDVSSFAFLLVYFRDDEITRAFGVILRRYSVGQVCCFDSIQ